MSEQENILQTIKTTVQDIVAPDVRELKVRLEAQRDQIASLEHRMDARFGVVGARFSAVDVRFSAVDARFDSVDARFDATDAKIASLELHITQAMEANLKTILAAVAQSRAENELMIFRQLAALSERVAALEAVRN